MKAQEVMGTVDKNGQLSLDKPLAVQKQSRVRVIVLFDEEQMDEDDESKEAVLESLRKSLGEAKTGKTRPISELWDGIDVE
ncbi:hypothetical protein SD81_003910 [Tolypothrix campylonemoides VB511288]|nr:hypothetical protein SD81_003910 [Tolypothrix campylonemoides VB511288]